MAGEIIDLANDAQTTNNIVPAVYTSTTQGAAVDMSPCKLLTNAIINVGTFGANMTSASVQLEECATTNGTFTKISDLNSSAQAICTITASNQKFVIRGQRTLRYARLNAVTVTGTTLSVALQGEIVSQLEFTGTGGGYSRSPST